jgi:eukaryotic-like serine/threonine-protein kinase
MVVKIDVGHVVAGKYELVRLLGRGAMGEVWRAMHNTLGGEVAIKLVEPADDVEAETAAGRFQLEAQIAAKLSRRTRHIVSVSDHGEEDGLAYLVMELLEGESLEQRMARNGALDLADVAAMVTQISRALLLAHEEGIFHRDIKPANIWLGRDEDGRLLVKLLDFGIARSKKLFRTRSPFMTSKDMVLGTPSYMSPEQARGLASLDHRCDVWALAVVAYEALAQKLPFDGQSLEDIFLSICTFRVVPLRARRPDLAPAVEAVFTRAFRPNLDERFGSAVEFSEAFEQLVTPEELDVALGIPAPSSARRLEAAARQSSSQLASSPQLEPNVGAGPQQTAPVSRDSHPDIGPPSSRSSHNLPSPARTSYPNLETGPIVDPMNVTLGTSVVKRRSGAQPAIIAFLVLLLLIGVGAMVVGFRAAGSPTVATHPADPENTASPQPTFVATSDPTALPTAPKPPIEPSSKVIAVPKAPPTSALRPSASGRALVRPPTPPPSATPAPPPPPAKPINKGDVF